MERSPRLLAALEAMGANGLQHLNGSLAQHLCGTEALLRAWGGREALCTAGLFHAVYGTDAFGPMLATTDQRDSIARVIGAEAEQLAYLYGACDRQVFYPRVGVGVSPCFPDRFTGTKYPISEATLADLCEITLANELEVLTHRPQFRSRHQRARWKLFLRAESLLSIPGREAFRRSSAGQA
jgi:hypothetical protein